MNKRLLCLLLAVLLLLGCTACGRRAEPPAVDPTRTAVPSEAPAAEETSAPTEELRKSSSASLKPATSTAICWIPPAGRRASFSIVWPTSPRW